MNIMQFNEQLREKIRDIALDCTVEYVASPVWAFSNEELDRFGEMIIKMVIHQVNMNLIDLIPPELESDGMYGSQHQYANGWNDCRVAILKELEIK